MAYGLIRVRNLSAGDIKSTEVHNARQYDELGLRTPDNISPDNYAAQFGSNTHTLNGGKTLQEAIDKRFETFKIKPRKNAVVALEYVVGLVGSRKEIEEAYYNYSAQTFLEDCCGASFLGEKHGYGNIVSMSLHFDESNPHAHFVVVPIVEKEVKWKNANGSGVKKEHRLCARDFTGHPDKLSQMQTDFHEHIKPYEQKLQVKIYRGTKKAEQLKTYTQQTNHELGLLRAKLDAAKTQAEAKAVSLEISAKKSEFEQKQGELGRIVEKHTKDIKKDDKWKKNKDFGIGF